MLINCRINIHFCANELGGETFNWHCGINEGQNIHFMIMNIKDTERLFHGELERIERVYTRKPVIIQRACI